jgi:periplasmic divalent cation tolerance protein
LEDRLVLIMVTTGGRNDAERLGEGLVETHLAACCSVVPTVHSFYYWEGQLKREHEALLLVKTLESRAQAVQEYVRANHSYERPEIIQVAIDGGLPAYLQWVADQVEAPATDRQVNT